MDHSQRLAAWIVSVLLLASCSRSGDDTSRLLQQFAILGEEVRATNAEVKLLKREIAELREELAAQTGVSPSMATAAERNGAACPLPAADTQSAKGRQPADHNSRAGRSGSGGPSNESQPASQAKAAPGDA